MVTAQQATGADGAARRSSVAKDVGQMRLASGQVWKWRCLFLLLAAGFGCAWFLASGTASIVAAACCCLSLVLLWMVALARPGKVDEGAMFSTGPGDDADRSYGDSFDGDGGGGE